MFLCLMFFCILPVSTFAQLKEEILETNKLELRVAPEAGGRVLFLALHNHPNFLKTGTAITQRPLAVIDENTPFIPYFGHEVWFGPQNEWWTHQSLLPKRKQQQSIWPPDPFTSFSANHLVTKTSKKILLKSSASPVNGLQVEKNFALVADNDSQVDLVVDARNTRDQPVAWDVWFNTRTFATTQIYAPVSENVNVRRLDWEASVPYDTRDGLLSLGLKPTDTPKKPIKGKIFFQPSEGWFAAFNQRQLLIVQFPLQPVEKIHPEQGQLEFYLEYDSADKNGGMLEMEVHSAYQKLAPGESIKATERWTLIEYSGDDSFEMQREFLLKNVKGLKNL